MENSTSHLQIQREFLEQVGRQVHPILGDGNCMFRALVFHVLGSGEEHYAMRSLLPRYNVEQDYTISTRSESLFFIIT